MCNGFHIVNGEYAYRKQIYLIGDNMNSQAWLLFANHVKEISSKIFIYLYTDFVYVNRPVV